MSVSTSLIPFLEHNDSSRALMGSNMQRQAVSLIAPEAPIVGTGMEHRSAVNSGQLVVAEESGEISYVDANTITMISDSGRKYTYQIKIIISLNFFPIFFFSIIYTLFHGFV